MHIFRLNLDSQLLRPSLNKPMQQSTLLSFAGQRLNNIPSTSPRTGLSDVCNRESCLNCDLHRIQHKKKQSLLAYMPPFFHYRIKQHTELATFYTSCSRKQRHIPKPGLSIKSFISLITQFLFTRHVGCSLHCCSRGSRYTYMCIT